MLPAGFPGPEDWVIPLLNTGPRVQDHDPSPFFFPLSLSALQNK